MEGINNIGEIREQLGDIRARYDAIFVYIMVLQWIEIMAILLLGLDVKNYLSPMVKEILWRMVATPPQSCKVNNISNFEMHDEEEEEEEEEFDEDEDEGEDGEVDASIVSPESTSESEEEPKPPVVHSSDEEKKDV